MTCRVNESYARACGRRVWLGAAHIVLIALLGLSTRARAERSEASPYQKLEVFARALSHIEQSYVDTPDGDRLMHGAIRGMLKELDPHSEFLDATELRILEDDAAGRFAGIGVEIDVRDGWLTVARVLEGGPAARAAVLPGDRFLTIEGLPVRDLPIADAVTRMRGEPGTTIRFELRRDGRDDALGFELKRELVQVRAVEARVLASGTAYLKIRLFQETTAREVTVALDHAQDASGGRLRGLLIDLRDNPGGLVGAAVTVADEFLAEGTIVETRGRNGRPLRTATAHASGTRDGFPIVLLINAGTASAAEILAGALRDHRRAVVVGARSFGKGSVQEVIGLPDGSALKLTTARYYTPSGTSIQAAGIDPDVQLPPFSTGLVARAGAPPLREASLEGHLNAERPAAKLRATDRGPRGSASVDSSAAREPFADDYEAHMAYQVLRALLATGNSGK